jgi:hypothetical protein
VGGPARGTQNISGTGHDHDKGDLIMAGFKCIAANVTETLNPADKVEDLVVTPITRR